MIKSFGDMFRSLLSNKYTYLIFLLALLITFLVADNDWVNTGMSMIPSSIGILLGGLLTTIAIIFGLIKDDDLKKLYDKHGEEFQDSLNKLKYHILIIISSLFWTIFAFIIKAPEPVISILLNGGIDIVYAFYFIQIFFLLITIYSTIEVVGILFLIFEIKLILINKNKNN